MTEALMNRIKAQLVRHEGLRLKPYRCTASKLTIALAAISMIEASPSKSLMPCWREISKTANSG